MSDPVTFLHASDLHYGAPLECPVLVSSRGRRWLNDARKRSLRRIVQLALNRGVDFVLWTGDLYERRWRSVEGGEFVREQLERLLRNEIDVLVTRGNTDPSASEGRGCLPDGATVFPTGEIEEATVRREGEPCARVLGWSPQPESPRRPSLEDFSPPDSSVFNLAVLHLSPELGFGNFSDTVQTLREASAPGVNYWGIGHGHDPRVAQGSPTVAAPGTPQGSGIYEPGQGGCLLVSADADAGATSIEFLPTADVVWTRETIDLEELDSPPESADGLRDALIERARLVRERSPSERTMRAAESDFTVPDTAEDPLRGVLVRWTVRGRSSLHTALKEQENVDRFLARGINDVFEDQDPFLMAESVHLRTGRELSPAGEDDEVLQVLDDLLEELREDTSLHAELKRVCGDTWNIDGEPESLAPDHLPLTEDQFEDLLDEAGALVVDHVLEEREDDVD